MQNFNFCFRYFELDVTGGLAYFTAETKKKPLKTLKLTEHTLVFDHEGNNVHGGILGQEEDIEPTLNALDLVDRYDFPLEYSILSFTIVYSIIYIPLILYIPEN